MRSNAEEPPDEVRLPEEGIDGSRFVIDQVLESFELKADGSPRLAGEPKEDLSCLQDAACFDNSALGIMYLYKRAVARLELLIRILSCSRFEEEMIVLRCLLVIVQVVISCGAKKKPYRKAVPVGV